MKKKTIIIIITLVTITILSLFSIYYDGARVRNGKEPKLTLKIVTNEGKKVTYLGLGYKVIRYPNSTPKEPYENNVGVKFGNWFMKYDKPKKEESIPLDKIPIQNENIEKEDIVTDNNDEQNESNNEKLESNKEQYNNNNQEDDKNELTPPVINEKPEPENNNLVIKNITDTTKLSSNFACAQAIDVFYEDSNYKYYYTCIRSNYIVVEYTNGTKENIKVALKNNRIKITDLDKYNISYLKEQKQTSIK